MGISVVGGSTTTTQDKTVVYGTPGTYTFTPPAGTSASNPLHCEVTVVGAGGGGGNYSSGSGITGTGGGAGQVIQQKSFYVTGPTTVTVGAGGAAATAGADSVFGTLTALGGQAGSTSTSATGKRAGTDDCTKGAAGISALRILTIGRDTNGQIYWKDPNDLTTANNFDSISKPPLTNPVGIWTVATNGSHIIACNTQVNGTNLGGNMTAFYSSGTGWTIRSVANFSSAGWGVATINGVAMALPGQAADTSTYYYAQNGSNTWTAATIPGVDTSNGQSWIYSFCGNREEFFVVRKNTTTIAKTTNGINWTTHTLPAAPSSGHFAGSQCISRFPGGTTYVFNAYTNLTNNGTNNIWTSTDLTTWTARTVTSQSSTNPNMGNNGEGPIAAVGGYYWWKGGSQDSGQANIFYSSNGYNWSQYAWNNDWLFGHTLPVGNLVFNNTWYAGNYAAAGNSMLAIRYGTFYPGSQWTANNLPNGTYVYGLTPYAVAGVSNTAPTAFAGITDLQPTGGSSGVPSTGGDGGNGGSYFAPTSKSTANSAAPTVGQVPGAGGGGGGAGSPTGAAGANGLVSIRYYG